MPSRQTVHPGPEPDSNDEDQSSSSQGIDDSDAEDELVRNLRKVTASNFKFAVLTKKMIQYILNRPFRIVKKSQCSIEKKTQNSRPR